MRLYVERLEIVLDDEVLLALLLEYALYRVVLGLHVLFGELAELQLQRKEAGEHVIAALHPQRYRVDVGVVHGYGVEDVVGDYYDAGEHDELLPAQLAHLVGIDPVGVYIVRDHVCDEIRHEIYHQHHGERRARLAYAALAVDVEAALGAHGKRSYVVERVAEHEGYVLDGEMPERDREKYNAILLEKAEEADYAEGLGFLSNCLVRYHEKNVVILIDEYDVPLENAYFAGFYEKMIGFIRSLFESALKTNAALAFGVVTGCLRISRESIFTGLNNLEIHSVLSYGYSDCFGFTEAEVKDLLEYYDLSEKYEELKRWYDGYRFGGQEIYNPWSIINYVKTADSEYNAFPRPYWSNTSSNSIIRELIENADGDVRREIEQLMEGETIEKPVHDAESNLMNSSGAQNEFSARRFFEINETKPQAQVEFSEKNILDYAGMDVWNFLYFTGYLKECGRRSDGETLYISLAIPNTEIRSIYRQSILTWFGKKMKATDRSPLMRALEQGDCQTAEDFISAQLLDTISYFDYGENYYHGFLAGLLSGAPGYQIISNRESGTGRADLLIKSTAIRKGRVSGGREVWDLFLPQGMYGTEAVRKLIPAIL